MQRTVEIGATARKEFGPDTIIATVFLAGEGRDREACIAHFNGRYNAIRNAFMAMGQEGRIVKNDGIDITLGTGKKSKRDHGFYKEGPGSGCGYSGRVSIEVPATSSLYNSVWHAVMDVDEHAALNIEYKLKKEDDARSELLQTAVAQARKRAEALAKATGDKLGPVLHMIHEFGDEEDELVTNFGIKAFSSGEGQSVMPEFSPEQIEVACTIRITWELLA